MGLEASAARTGEQVLEYSGLFSKFINVVYLTSAYYHSLKKGCEQFYRVSLDGLPLHGNYIGILVANQPYYGKGLCPAAEAEPNDGLLDVYLIRAVPPLKFWRIALDYVHGFYNKWPGYILHFKGKTLTVSSNKIMPICVDGEMFYDFVIEYEAIPHALDFVCPGGIGQDAPAAEPRSLLPTES
jgi:diacylglycerol kinase family enzyme